MTSTTLILRSQREPEHWYAHGRLDATRDPEVISGALRKIVNIAAVEALRHAVQLLEERFEFSAGKAYCHASLCGNLIVSQLVNFKKGIHSSVDNIDTVSSGE